jgi:hypothetical protein
MYRNSMKRRVNRRGDIAAINLAESVGLKYITEPYIAELACEVLVMRQPAWGFDL